MGQMQTFISIYLHVSKCDFPLLFSHSTNSDQPSHKSWLSSYQDCVDLTSLPLLQKRGAKDINSFLCAMFTPVKQNTLSGTPKGQGYGHQYL